jgi:hypothetical protein
MLGVNRWPIAWVLIAAALAIYPLLPAGIPSTADGPLHLIRGVEFDAVLRSGVLYPRWAPDLAFGYGYPIFNFYAPLFYYLTEIPHLFGAGFELALKLVIFIGFVVYGLGTYWWTRPFLGEVPAAVAGVAYMYIPFRFHEVYMQGDYPQFLALALAPVALGAIYRLFVSPSLSPWRLAAVAGTLSAILLAHNISTLWLAPTLAGYALTLTVGLRLGNSIAMRRSLARLACVAGLGTLVTGLTAFFWLPALAEQNLVQLYRLRTDDYDVRHSFIDVGTLLAPPRVVDQLAANPPPYLHLGWGQVGLALLTIPLAVLVVRLCRRAVDTDRLATGRLHKTHLIFGWVVLLASGAMTLPVSTPVWRRIPLIAYTQFPWRVLELSGLATALLAGLAVSLGLRLATNPRWRFSPAAVIGIALAGLILPSLVYLYPRQPFLTYGNLTSADVTAFERNGGAVGTTSTGEYYPIGVTDRPTASLPTNLSEVGRLDRASLPPGGTAAFVGASGYSEQYAVALSQAATARFNVIRFAGWQASIDGETVETRSNPGNGLLLVDLPAGSHQLGLDFVDTGPRRIGWIVAAMSLALSVAALLRWSVARRRAKWSVEPVGSGEPDSSAAISRRSVLALSGGLVACFVLRAASPPLYAQIFTRRSDIDRVVGIEHPMQIRLEDKAEFLGYDLHGNVAIPGAQVPVTLYWRALIPLKGDYRSLAMVASVDERSLLTQDDRPSPGGIPTHTWPSNRYFVDDHTIDIPPDATPKVYRLQVALYDPTTGQRLQQAGVDGFAGQQIVLQQIHVVRPKPIELSSYRSAGDPIFGGMIALQGYQVNTDHPKAGQSLTLTLVWKANRAIPADYTVFTHLVDASQNQTAGRDSVPVSGQYPTSEWLPDEQVIDAYDIPIPATAAPGPHHLAVGFYDPKTMQRLDANVKGWNEPRSQVDLDLPVTVEPG